MASTLKRYAFVINGTELNIGKATGQRRARTLLKETVELLRAKSWQVDTQKADHVVLVDTKGKVRSLSLVG